MNITIWEYASAIREGKKKKKNTDGKIAKHFQVSDLILWAHSVIEAGPDQLMQHQIK